MNWFKRLVLSRDGDDLKVKDVEGKNSFSAFLDTLTPEEREGDFLSLSNEKQILFVKNMGLLQVEAMGSVEDAALKALLMLAMKLHKNNMDEFNFSYVFPSTIENVKDEVFNLRLYKTTDLTKCKETSELADGTEKEPNAKFASILDQDSSIENIINKLNDTLPFKGRTDLPLTTSGILLIAEFMSQTNSQDLSTLLENLIDGNTPLNVSFRAEAKREEIEYQLTHAPVKRIM